MNGRRGSGFKLTWCMALVIFMMAVGSVVQAETVTRPIQGYGLSKVGALAYSRDGSRIAVACGTMVQIIEAQTGKKLLILNTGGLITSLVFSADGGKLVTGSMDWTARLWDVATGNLLQTFSGHTNSINSVAISDDGSRVLTGSNDAGIFLWDANTGTRLKGFGNGSGVSFVTFSPDGKKMVYVAGYTALSDLDTGKGAILLWNQYGFFSPAAFSSGGRKIVTVSPDKTIRIWDGTTGNQIKSFHVAYRPQSVAFSPDATKILVGLADYPMAKLLDASTGALIYNLVDQNGPVNYVAFSSTGKTILTFSHGRTVDILDSTRYREWNHDNVRLWDAATGKVTRTFTGSDLAVNSVAFSPDGKSVLTAGGDAKATLWDKASGVLTRTFAGHIYGINAAAFSRDGKTLLTASADHTARLWEVATGKQTTLMYGHLAPVNAAAWAPDAATVLTGADDNMAFRWKVPLGEARTFFTGNFGPVRAVAVSPDGKTALTGSDDWTARLWEASTGKVTRTLFGHYGSVSGVAFSPDGNTVLTGSADKTAKLWDKSKGTLLRTFTGHTNKVLCVAFAPDGKTVLTGSADNTARLWDAATGASLRTFTGHSNAVNSVAFSRDGKSILTGSADGTALLWNTGGAAK